MGAHWIPSDEAASLGWLRDRLASADLSPRIFDLGWAPRLAGAGPGRILATGFFCRRQTKRFAGFRPPHPVEAVLAHLQGSLG